MLNYNLINIVKREITPKNDQIMAVRILTGDRLVSF